ncbi:hypothetical protein ACH4TC_38355 [Streptomyces spororaveus]|uniref:hypothetical protein n=1 Tax=Streptomyces spororaveus TaxID=284039 RepID=UPI0037A5FE79
MSDRVESTEQDRLERLGSMLAGQRAQGRAGRLLGRATCGNVLLGAMLHGADRERQGQTPTDLEQLLLDALKTAVSEEEAQQWGRVYRETVAAQGGGPQLVPQTISSRPVEQGYGFEDLRKDFPELVAEALAAPNVQIVDPHALTPGEPEDPAFIEAMGQAGFAVTAYGRSEPAPTEQGTAAKGGGGQDREGGGGPAGTVAALPFRVRLELDNFYVARAVGDQGGGRDEIYWTAAVGTGGEARNVYYSQEFGAVQKGQTRHFTGADRQLFDATVGDYLGLSIQVWEADQSGDKWWNGLVKALNDAAAAIDRVLLYEGFIGVLPTWATTAFEIGKIFLSIIEVFRNHDDLSCQRQILLDRHHLAALTHWQNPQWHFNGDGHHVLTFNSTGGPVPFPAGTLEYALRTGDTWGTPLALPWQSMTPPALASYNNKLYALFVRPTDKAVMWTRLDSNNQWSPPQRVGYDITNSAPAVTVAHGKLCYAVAGLSGGLFWRTFTEAAGWSAVSPFPHYVSLYGPTLGTFANRVWVTNVNHEGTIYLTTYNGTEWSIPYEDNLPWQVTDPIAFAPYNGHIWRIARGLNGKIYTSSSAGDINWTDRGIPNTTWTTGNAPALAAHDNKMWIFMRGLDSTLYAASYNGTWSATHQVTGGAAKPMDAPAAASHNNKLYVMYRR